MEGVRHEAAREMSRAAATRAVLEIDFAAIRHNLGIVERYAGGAKLMGVVKGDAYGLGAPAVSRFLQDNGVEAFAVDSVAEAIALRENGVERPILIIDGDVPENAPLAIERALTPGIAQEELLDSYERAAAARGVRHPVWLVVNVGFNRSGYRDRERLTSFMLRARDCSHLQVGAIYAHLTNSNGDAAITREQINDYRRAADLAKEIFGAQIETSLFASHGLVRWSHEYQTDWLRPGIILYGEHAFVDELIEPETAQVVGELKPAVSLRARVIQLLDFEREERVGYGQVYRTRPGQRLATVSLGFGSGYPFGSRNLYALAHGKRVPLAGAVGMDALQLDVTEAPDLKLYDWVTLIGAEGDERITVAEVARAAGMSTYELLRQLRSHHVYMDGPETAREGR